MSDIAFGQPRAPSISACDRRARGEVVLSLPFEPSPGQGGEQRPIAQISLAYEVLSTATRRLGAVLGAEADGYSLDSLRHYVTILAAADSGGFSRGGWRKE